MRWMKHLCLAHDDNALAAVLEEFGPEGYGIYWLLLEHVGAGIEKDSEAVPSRTHSEIKWAQILHTTTRKFRRFAQKSAELRLIECKTQAELMQFASRTQAVRVQIDIPKLLKYRDEYSKKTGQTSSQEQIQIEKQKQRESREEYNTPAASAADQLKAIGWQGGAKTPEAVCDRIVSMKLSDFAESKSLESPYMVYSRLVWFDEFWAYYWRKDDKKTARAAYLKHVTTLEMKDRVDEAVIAQSPGMTAREKKYQPLASTWLNKERWDNEPELPLLEVAS